MLEALPLLVVVALVALASLSLRRRAGVVRPDAGVLTAAELMELGVAADRPAFVLFTAPGCGTCAPARQIVAEVAAQRDVPVVTVDATQHERLVAAHGVLRAPTTFVVESGGRIVGRVSGVPRPADLAATLGSATGADVAA